MLPMNAVLGGQETLKEQGLTPIGTRWIFTNKGDTEHFLIRARLVAQET